MSDIVQVFVSSTWLDLQPERQKVEAALQRLRETKFVGMEYFGSRDETTRQTSLDEVDRSQVYVGIIAGRYGSGITADEYYRARDLGLPCFVYFKCEADVAPEWQEAAPERVAKLAALKDELRQNHIVTEFNHPDDLAARITADLHNWLVETFLTPRLEEAAQGRMPREQVQELLAAILDEQGLDAKLIAAARKVVTASGTGAVAIGGDVSSATIITGDGNVAGNQAGRDLVGRDQVTNIFQGPVYQGGPQQVDGGATAEKKTSETEVIKKTVEEADKFVLWIIEVLRSKNKTTKLLLLDVLFFTVFNPISFHKILNLFDIKQLPRHYALYFWVVIGAIFMAAVAVTWRTRPKSRRDEESINPSAIKALLPYERADAHLFTRLQRQDDLKECLRAITSTQFRFGILCGRSGNGKTSLLQAGLWPALLQQNHRCAYVECTRTDPIEAIFQAFGEQFSLSDEVKRCESLPTLFEAMARLDLQRPMVIILDQFEQFYVHQKRKQDREPFLRAMEEWFKHQATLPVKIVICLRSDFLDRQFELQKRLGYSLGPHQSFTLDKFTPEQAAEVFHVIADQEGIECDDNFVKKMASEELADPLDGLVSPVDIQILAWMITAQKDIRERTFNRRSFEKLGRVEGLLERFLKHVLSKRETEARRQAAIKVLLALTDPDRNTRAGALTLAEVKVKLQGNFTAGEIEEAIKWLARSDVRLIAPVKQKEIVGYELVHERLIPALCQVAGQLPDEAARVNHLLNRRVSEWLSNQRSKRYLLSWREMRRLNQQAPFLTWDPHKSAKEALIAASLQHQRRGLALLASPALLIIGVLFLWSSTWGQLYLIKRDLTEFSNTVTDGSTLVEIAGGFAAREDYVQALKVVEKISDDRPKAKALNAIATAVAKLGDKQQAAAFLDLALRAAKQISNDSNNEMVSDDGSKADALRDIATAVAKLGDKQQAAAFLDLALRAAEKISEDVFKNNALKNIATGAANIGMITKDKSFFDQSFKAVEKISDDLNKILALPEIAVTAIKLGEVTKDKSFFDQALKAMEKISRIGTKIYVLGNIANAVAKLGDQQQAAAFLDQALKIVEESSDSYRARPLYDIAATAIKLGEATQDKSFFDQALKAAEKINDGSFKVKALSDLATAVAKLDDKQRAAALLDQALRVVEESSEDGSNVTKDSALESATTVAAEIAVITKDKSFFDQALKAAEKITGDDSKAKALSNLATAVAKLDDKQRAAALLDQALRVVEESSEDGFKAKALPDIATTAIKLGDVTKDKSFFDQALKAAEKISGDSFKALLDLATAIAKLDDKQRAAALLDLALKAAEKISGDSSKGKISNTISKASTLSDVATTFAEIGEITKHKSFFDQALKVVEKITTEIYRDKALLSIVLAMTKIGDLRMAHATAVENISSNNEKAQALALILKTWSESKNPSLMNESEK